MSASSQPWPTVLRLAALWLVYSAWSSVVGWGLSGISQLNGKGYALATPLLLGAGWMVWRASGGSRRSSGRVLPRLRKRPLAIAWVLVVVACLVGGIAYAPSNYDALSYRLPRLMYWWQENHWHWLEHADDRMNFIGVGFEWQMLPLMVLEGGDRLLFLINWVPFLFFPALSFHGLVVFGVGKKSAARWMWILPLGYGFALQASSIGNDGLGGILVMAALTFAGLAEKRSSVPALALSAVAISALTGLKLSNLPLVLPLGWFWAKAAWSLRAGLFQWSLAPSLAAVFFAGFFLLAILSQRHCGHWSGDPEDKFQVRVIKPLPGLVGNAYFTLTGLTQPPVFPLSTPARRALTASLEGDNSFASWVRTGFPRFRATSFSEIPTEEGAGIGLGLTLLIGLHVFGRRVAVSSTLKPWVAVAATVVASLAYMISLGSESTARLTLPYSVLWISCLLALFPRSRPLAPVARFTHSWLALVCLLPGLVLNPNRPLVPLGMLAGLPMMPASYRHRISDLQEAYASRNDPLKPFRADLPCDGSEVGFAGGPTQSSYSLFKPFGSRRVVEGHAGNLRTFTWLLACPSGILERAGQPWEAWLASAPYEIVTRHPVTFTVQHGREEWFLLKAKSPPPHSQSP